MKVVVSTVITFQKVNPFTFTLFEVVYIKFCHKKIPLPKGKMSIASRLEYLNYRFDWNWIPMNHFLLYLLLVFNRMYSGPKLGQTLDSELGNYYSTFLWRFTDKTKNTDFNDFLDERFDAGYMLTCICFVILGSFGTSLNGRACYNFCRTKTVISEMYFKLLHITQLLW